MNHKTILLVSIVVGIGLISCSSGQEVKDIGCNEAVVKIEEALAAYYSWSAKSYSGEGHFPDSLNDTKFINDFLQGALPPHPLGWKWNDFYNPKTGRIFSTEACEAAESF